MDLDLDLRIRDLDLDLDMAVAGLVTSLPDSAPTRSRSWDLSVTSLARYRYTTKPANIVGLKPEKNG